jgi:hypothetical protein
LQGRVNIAARALAMSSFPISSLFSGAAVDALGVRPVFALLSVFLFASATFGLIVPDRAEVSRQIAALQEGYLRHGDTENTEGIEIAEKFYDEEKASVPTA